MKVYESADNTAKFIKIILFFKEAELQRMQKILRDLGLERRREVVLLSLQRRLSPAVPCEQSGGVLRDGGLRGSIQNC
jgi:hypothetical protein